jgi:hypothetical protein
MQHFYDNQIRRYLLQVIRLMSNFYWKDGEGDERQIPVSYGDISRQVANQIAQNSEASTPSVPRMAVYITGLAIDNSRRADSSYVHKLHIKERRYDSAGNEYLDQEGKNYTVERLMPTPYVMTVNVDIWSSNTDQKLQILEQLLVLFNPSLEIQTTDNYVDWTSLTVVNLTNVNWSNRSIPVGTDDDIDIAQLTFEIPIFISPPAKVKRLGVITNIISSIFVEETGTIAEGLTKPELNQYQDIDTIGMGQQLKLDLDEDGNVTEITQNSGSQKGEADAVVATNYQDCSVIILNGKAELKRGEGLPPASWEGYVTALPFQFKDYVTTLKLRRADTGYEITGSVSVDPLDETKLDIDFDIDSTPSDTIIDGPNSPRSNVDYVVNPYSFNPTPYLSAKPRILILEDINTSQNVGQDVGETPDNYRYDGPDAWKNTNGEDTLIASAGDIIEWSGSEWLIVFDASEHDSGIVYTTNLNTGIQYKYTTEDQYWTRAFDGLYPAGTWRLDYN